MNEEELQRIERGDESFGALVAGVVTIILGVIAGICFITWVVFK